jgi:hypothetical protein
MTDLDADSVESLDEHRTDIEDAIAEHIAQLSEASDTPSEFEPPGRALPVAEIEFRSAAWLTALAEVQGWLRLPEQLELTSEDEFLRTLVLGLEFDREDEGVEQFDGRPRLTTQGLDRLNARLQRAARFQTEFQADLEADGASRASATGLWRERWEEDSDDEEGGDPVSAKADTWPINDFSDRARKGRLNLSPSYQRGDVWPTSDAQLLIESILRGIPLPSVIILKPEAGDAPFEVVDGKQRLTTILRFIGKHPRALARVADADAKHEGANFKKLFEENYPAFRRQWKNLMGEQLSALREREYYFPFKLRNSKAMQGDLSALQGKYYTQIKDARVRVADTDVEVSDVFEHTTDYKIPLIVYSRATRRQIHEVFNLYNKQGKHLNAEEIRNAVYHEVALARALLVVAGDNTDIEGVAPFLSAGWDQLEEVSEMLDAYGIGSARYRRTKVLSWLASLLLVDAMEGDTPRRLSTARHIDSLLDRVQSTPDDSLRKESVIREVFLLLHAGIDAHSAVDEAWAPRFKDTKNGAKWQELQLIASVLGVTIAAAVLGDETEGRLSASADTLRENTASSEWQRPAKTQTATQWEFISRIAIWTVEAMGVDPQQASTVLRDRFGHSCVPTLLAGVPSQA